MKRSKLFCVIYQIQISFLAKVLKCELTSHPFWFKRELSALNMILERLKSFDSVFRDIARPTIDSAINLSP